MPPKQEKKVKEQSDVLGKIKNSIPDKLIPKNMDKDKLVKFLSETYEKGSDLFKVGAKKVSEASVKIANSTKLYYQFNQSKVKMHLLHTKLGELVELKYRNGAKSVDLSDSAVNKLLSDLQVEEDLSGRIKAELNIQKQ